MGRRTFFLVCAVALFVTACENDFTPKAGFEPQIAVFCILDDAQPYQSVLIFRSYDAELGLDLRPLTPREVEEADVRILYGSEIWMFHDSLLTAADGSTRHAWINRDFHPLNERTYRLEVRIPGENLLHARVTVPSRLYVRAERYRPPGSPGMVRVTHGVTSFAVPPEGFYYRVWSETWKRLPSGDTVKPRIEIPLNFNSTQNAWVYPLPSREGTLMFLPATIEYFMKMNEQPEDSVIARRLYLHGYGMDEQMYRYYKLVRGFDDPVSVRLDLPDVSYIEGGLGVFGAMTSDSTSSSIFGFIGF
ncbi:MAG: DUF4249 family protein [Bacteroidetes bacterium]|nr:DUF4249 family protein [Bacteroidota bacterium]